MKERKESLPSVKKDVSMRVVYPSDIKRIYFNRFSMSKADGVQLVNVFYQDELLRTSNAYSFVFDDEDFATCSANIKNYLMRVMQESSVSNDKGHDAGRSAEVQQIDTARFMMCSRSGNRAEIYLGFCPLAVMINPDSTSSDLAMNMGVVLCSRLGCHIELLRRMVEGK